MFKDKEFLLDPNRIIAPGKKAKNLKGKTFNEVIDIFNERIAAFFIKPAKLIKTHWNTDYGFILIGISAILIDLLNQYEDDLPESSKTSYIKFLKKNINEFNSNFKLAGNFIYYDRGNKIKEHSVAKDRASIFYSGFRCGIVHNAMVLSCGGYDETPKNILNEEAWNDKNGIKHIELVVHPINLFDEVEKIFKNYIQDLKDPNNISLRNNFKRKFLRDFGYGD